MIEGLRFGEIRHFAAGDALAAIGQVGVGLAIILSGTEPTPGRDLRSAMRLMAKRFQPCADSAGCRDLARFVHVFPLSAPTNGAPFFIRAIVGDGDDISLSLPKHRPKPCRDGPLTT